MTTKTIKVVTYNKELPSIRSYDPLVTWPLTRCLDLERKRLNRHQLPVKLVSTIIKWV